MSLLSACVQPNPENYYFELDTQPTNLVTSVSGGTFISVDNTNPAVPVINSTLVAGTGVAIASGVLNAISASTASSVVQTFSAPQVDLEATGAVNVMTIAPPVARAKIYKVHMSGSFQYSDPSINPVVFQAYCSTVSEAPNAVSGDTLVNITNLVAPSTFTFGQPAAFQSGGGGTGTWTTNECVFLVQNPTGATVSSLFFIMKIVPNDGSQSAGVLNDVALTATVEAFL